MKSPTALEVSTCSNRDRRAATTRRTVLLRNISAARLYLSIPRATLQPAVDALDALADGGSFGCRAASARGMHPSSGSSPSLSSGQDREPASPRKVTFCVTSCAGPVWCGSRTVPRYPI